MGTGFLENSQESEGILGESEGNKDKEHEEIVGAWDLGRRQGMLNLDLNSQPEDAEIGIRFHDNLDLELGSRVPEKQTQNNQSVHCREAEGSKGSFLFGVDLKRMERDPDGDERGSSSSKRRRHSIEEKGKAKEDGEKLSIGINDANRIRDLDIGVMQLDPIGEEFEKGSAIGFWYSIPNEIIEHNFMEISPSNENTAMEKSEHQEKLKLDKENLEILGIMELVSRRKDGARRRHEIARENAERFAHFNIEEEYVFGSSKQGKEAPPKEVEEKPKDFQGPFSEAMEMIQKRNSSSRVGKKSLNGALPPDFKWVPSNKKGCNVLKRCVPSLLDLSVNALAKNAEAMVSLEHVPDALRRKLSRVLCGSSGMDAHFLELLARGSPTEIRVNDCTLLTEEEFTKIFGDCDPKNLMVLQLDLCGRFMSDFILRDTLARSSCSLPALATISLRGAYRLTEDGLTALCASAPQLQSINLSQCLLLTTTAINALTNSFESTLRELYIDECQNIDVMLILPALKKLKCLEILSVAGVETVRDDFVIGLVKECGANMKELGFANCLDLTDISLKFVGEYCPRLCTIDLSYLSKLTDSAIQYLANGCPSINILKLCRNNFSDEAIAALLEVSGDNLNQLSLNKISKVGFNTALSLAKCSRNLFSLDLSWCRNLTDEALGLIVDSCLSLRLLKLFGCTQITDVFLNGHSNSQMRIVGLRLTPVLEHLDVLEPQRAPLRYSALTFSAD